METANKRIRFMGEREGLALKVVLLLTKQVHLHLHCRIHV